MSRECLEGSRPKPVVSMSSSSFFDYRNTNFSHLSFDLPDYNRRRTFWQRDRNTNVDLVLDGVSKPFQIMPLC